jgi:Ca2+-binding RTX toxin-like protein
MGSRLLSSVAAAAALAVAVFPSSAGGATVSVSGGVLTVRDTGAVVNQITVEPWVHESDGILITERGPTLLTAGGGCILWDEDILHPRGDKVFCTGQFFQRIAVDTGDGSDSIAYAVESSAGTLLGGAGDDVLTAALGEAELRGGAGDDILSGLEGNQLIAGDEGIDTVDYTNRGSDPVDVSLDGVANDGIRDFEFDNVQPSTENVRGSFGGGVIVGSAAANRLEGGPGNDEIDGGAGADVLLGFAGDDILVSADGKRDVQVDCGIGLDSSFADHQDPLRNVRHPGATCESVSYVKPRDLASPGPG